MKRLPFVLLVLVALGGAAYFTVVPVQVDRHFNTYVAPPPYDAGAAARAMHDTLFIADLHNDLLFWRRDPVVRHGYGNTDVPRLIEGGVALQVFGVFTKSPRGQNYERNASDSDRLTPLVIAQRWPVGTWGSLRERALYQAAKLHDAAGRSGGRLVLIRTRRDLYAFLDRRAREPEILAGLLGMEGMHPLEGDLAAIDLFFEAGYRMMGLTHFFDNEVAGSAHGLDQGGLTELGRRAVARMEERGILIDLAHASPRAIDDVLALATRPVVVSHTGVQGTCPGPRNLTDAQLRGVAATGGIVGIGFWDGAVCTPDAGAIARALRYAADVAGIAHVGLGSDFDGSIHAPFDATGWPLLTRALQDEGFTPQEIAALMGGNVLRVLRQTLPPGTPPLAPAAPPTP